MDKDKLATSLPKLTTRELVEMMCDLEYTIEELVEEKGEESSEVQTTQWALERCKEAMGAKAQSIDSFSVELTRRTGLIDAEAKTMRDEVKRLMKQKNAIKRTQEYFNKVLLPMLIEQAGNDGVLRTNTSKYTLYETWGPIEIEDEDAIPDKYKRAKIEVDKKGARPDVIEAAENGMGIAGFSISKAKRVRRS